MNLDKVTDDAADMTAWNRAAARPSLRFAFFASLVAHTFFVFVLYRAYTELAGENAPPIRIVARARMPRPVSTPAFATGQPAATVLQEEIIRPVARPVELSSSTATLPPTMHQPRIEPKVSTRRATAIAAMPVIPVELPPVVESAAPECVELPSLAPAVIDLARANAPPKPSIRIAARPTYGPSEHRAVGIAVLNDAKTANPNRLPTPAFVHRGVQSRLSRESRTAIDLGLEFLARVQFDDGRWRFSDLRGVDPLADAPATQRADAAATGLALLAFLGAGHDHTDGRYQHVVRDGLQFLTRMQQDRGNFFWDDAAPEAQITRFYSHGIATLALCEALGMTGDSRLRGPAQSALNYLAGSNDANQNTWRYQPGVNSDAAATGWQLAALQTGELAGLRVEPQTFARVRECLAMCRVRELQSEPLLTEELSATTVNTAVGLAVDLHLGKSQQDDGLRGAADHLLAHPPEVRPNDVLTPTADADEPINPRRDNYYWYYGSEAMHRLGGNDWQAWSADFYPHLVETQIRTGPLAGSWESRGKTSTYGNDCSGRLYVTAMNLLSLEIQQRQLPLKAAAPAAADKR